MPVESTETSSPIGGLFLRARLGAPVKAALRRPWIAFFCLVAAVFAAYRPALDAQFIWDDTMLVRENGLIRSPIFVLEVFRHTLFGGLSNFYRPIQSLVFIGDYWCWGLQPFGYHLTSITIHALNGFVLFLLLRRLLPSMLAEGDSTGVPRVQQSLDFVALSLALVWSLYPIHSATVAYVAGSADSLAMLFCVLAWLSADRCLRATQSGARVAWGAAAGLCLLSGFCSKEIAFVWLALFALHQFLFSRENKTGLRDKWPLIAGSVVVVGCYALLRHIPVVPVPPASSQHFSRGLMALRALGDYGSLLVFPDRLLMERQIFPAPEAVLSAEDRLFYNSLTAGGVLLLVVFALGMGWRGNGQRLRVYGVCWFMAGFLPVSNLFVTINASVAEHWLYLPSIGFLLFVTGCAWQVPTHRLRVGAFALALVAATAFGVRTYWRAFDWMDETTFFRQTVAAGGDVPRARLGFANALSHDKQDAAALDILRQVSQSWAGSLSAEVNLANALGRLGRPEEAKPILEHAFMRSETAEPHVLLVLINNLENLEKDKPGWPAMKQAALARARQNYPDSWELVQADAFSATREGHPLTAQDEVAKYARTHWWHYPSWYMLGCMYAEDKKPALAMATLKQASLLDILDVEALSAAAELCLNEGKAREAVELERQAVGRQPESAKQRVLLSQMLAAASQPLEAARELAVARTLLQRAEVAGK